MRVKLAPKWKAGPGQEGRKRNVNWTTRCVLVEWNLNPGRGSWNFWQRIHPEDADSEHRRGGN